MCDDPQSESSWNLGQLKRTLEERRRELFRQMSVKIRDVREAGQGVQRVNIAEEFAATDVHDDLDATLLQMKSETLLKIEKALRRMEEGRYGTCSECGGDIAPVRLLALPFAVRCTECQEAHERAFQRRESSARFGWRGLGE